jgi:hypothetical protein
VIDGQASLVVAHDHLSSLMGQPQSNVKLILKVVGHRAGLSPRFRLFQLPARGIVTPASGFVKHMQRFLGAAEQKKQQLQLNNAIPSALQK